jgi:hypothetical protein
MSHAFRQARGHRKEPSLVIDHGMYLPLKFTATLPCYWFCYYLPCVAGSFLTSTGMAS